MPESISFELALLLISTAGHNKNERKCIKDYSNPSIYRGGIGGMVWHPGESSAARGARASPSERRAPFSGGGAAGYSSRACIVAGGPGNEGKRQPELVGV